MVVFAGQQGRCQTRRRSSTRQPCFLFPIVRDSGQWFCVPPFRVVCLLRVFSSISFCRQAVIVKKSVRTPRDFHIDPSLSIFPASSLCLKRLFPIGACPRKILHPRRRPCDDTVLGYFRSSLLVSPVFLSVFFAKPYSLGAPSSIDY